MNFKQILSKASLVSSISDKSTTPQGENMKLLSDLENLKQTIETLKNTIENKDEIIGTLTHEKDKLYKEYKSVQRTNRNLHQQLEDERDMHAKEKEFLINEIKRITNSGYDNDNQNRFLENFENHCILEAENKTKDQIIFNVCEKYLKMKSSKMIFQKKFKKLQARCQKACGNILVLLRDNRKTMDNLLNKIIESSNTSISKKNYMRLLKDNADLHYENTQLKVRITLCIPHPNDISVNRKKLKKNNTNKIISDLTKKNCRAVIGSLNYNRYRHKNYSEHSYKNHWVLCHDMKLFKSKSDPCLPHQKTFDYKI